MFYRGQGTPFVRDPWEKWPPKIHFVPPNLRTTRRFLISWLLPRHPPLPPPPSIPPASARGLCPSYFASFYSTAVSRKDRRETRGIRLSFHSERETNETRGNRLCYSDAPAMSSPFPPPSLPRLSLPRCFPLLCGEFVFRGDERKAPWP